MNHIKSIHDETKSWCGEILNSDFHFKSIEHAVLNGMHEATIATCVICTDEVIRCLMRGAQYLNRQTITGIVP